ncbi:diguanylate cyclase [Halarcobacter sp.]|uniref:GGDEF domain-containing response regulator n=1 Tax=Halarcobacter sp. TaxID=2321133 RepID=UPI0029F546CC|nr:diguanylate cyclase [Halarcobacter sp.]
MNKEILKEINVLYVEDEDEVREFTSKTISSIVNQVVVAKDGKEGLEKYYENNQLNLILTDINMPRMGGLEMCNIIREKDKEIPIVITSAHSDPNFLKEAIDVNVSSYAMKPIDLYHLIDSMIKAVEPIFLKKRLENITKNLEHKVEEVTKQTKLLLDAQANIVFLTNLSKIVEVNKKFLDFFAVSSYEEFLATKKSIVSQFKEDKRFFNKAIVDTDSHWILEIQKLTEADRVVKMENKYGEDRIFTVTIDDYENKKEHFVISLTDITTLKEKSNLLEYQATHDQLTGLFNRQKFNDIFLKEIKRDKRYDNALSIIVFNIDNFTNIIDKSGRDVCNNLLKDVAQIVINSVREHDIVVRWAEEEFLILLPQTEVTGASRVAQKILENIQEHNFPYILEEITASFGISKLLEEDNDISILKRVEDALAKAKEEGKNKIICN